LAARSAAVILAHDGPVHWSDETGSVAGLGAAEKTTTPKRRLAMDTYYDPTDLSRFGEIGEEAPELARKFFDYYGAVFAEGELTQREKALIALGVAHAVQCPYCIDAYTQACLEQGSNLGEMTEAVHVANAIRGGASLVHGVQMRKVAKKLSL
jgi:4-carboxymuconolactone decarboxylase